ncbi:MAG: hypothetical protein M3417_14720 [Actinomycetota bacterium]|nr:hypothetical protein [Actinomycetota bacterium]
MAEPPQLQRSATTVLSGLMVVLGVAIIVRTVAAGGSPISVGLLLGVLFVLAGGGRLYLAARR